MKDNPYMKPILLLICKHSARRAWLCKYLAEFFEIIVEIDPQKALTASECIHLDFILLDTEIIKEDLLSYCHKLRLVTLSESTSLYLITGRLKKDFLDQAKKQGITEFIHSQLNEDEIKTKMKEGIENLSKQRKTKKLFSHLDLASLASGDEEKTLAYRGIVSFSEAKEKKLPSSVLMIKVSDFAELSQGQKNDLKRVIQSNLEEEDVLIPTKEGHFFVVLPKTKESKANELAKNIQGKFAKLPKSIDISIALSEANVEKKESSAKEFDHLIQVANKTLAEIKRNQIKIFKS